jgi:CRP/FNR family transcriptional regulator, anaerobic regulatory protein
VAPASRYVEAVDFLSLLSEDHRRLFLERSTRDVYPAGTLVFRPGAPETAFLLEQGLVRVFCSVPDGRQATVAFSHPNEVIGGTTIAGQAPATYCQVVVESVLVALDVDHVRALMAREIEVALASTTHLAAVVRNAFRLIAVRSLGNIAERTAYDLLERACRSQLAVGRLEIRATHADLADSIGSSREVVSRALRRLRSLGILETSPGLVRVADPERLAGIVRAFVI